MNLVPANGRSRARSWSEASTNCVPSSQRCCPLTGWKRRTTSCSQRFVHRHPRSFEVSIHAVISYERLAVMIDAAFSTLCVVSHSMGAQPLTPEVVGPTR